MPGSIFISLIGFMFGIVAHQWWKHRKATDLSRYPEASVVAGAEILQSWYTTHIEKKIPIGAREYDLSFEEIVLLNKRMDLTFATAISKRTKCHLVHKGFNKYILRFVK